MITLNVQEKTYSASEKLMVFFSPRVKNVSYLHKVVCINVNYFLFFLQSGSQIPKETVEPVAGKAFRLCK